MAQDLLMKRIKAVFRVTSGHFLEMFDFILFGFYATYIAKTFFPSESEYASLMLTLLTFGAGFLMRPLGAIILGSYVDRVGRRKGLILTLSLMAVATLIIAFTPGYATIGALAPLLILIGRLLQGFSAARNLEASRCISRRWRPRARKASMWRGSRSRSRSASCWRRCSATE